MDREYPSRPWVGIGVVVWQDDRVLLVQRGRPPRLGEWGLPGGAQRVGETIFDAAIREVQEETALTVAPYAIVTAVDGITRDQDGKIQYHYSLIEVAADCRSGNPIPSDDVTATQWVALDDVANMVSWSETLRVIFLSAGQRRIANRGGFASPLGVGA